MHKKDLGSLGEIAVAKHLIGNGYTCFVELGDNSKADIIALIDNVPILIQVKTRTLKNGKLRVSKRKSVPNYEYIYKESDIDVVAFYSYESDLIGYVSIKEFISKSVFTLRVEPVRNNQKKGIVHMSEYSDIKQALNDYVPRTFGNE